MTIQESVGKGFSAAKKSTPVVLALFVFGFVWGLINIFYTSRVQGASPDAATTAKVFGVSIAFILMSVYMQSGLIGYIRDLLKQQAAELKNFTASSGKYFLRLFVIGLIVALTVGVCVLLAALSFAFFQQRANAVGVILALLFGAAAIYAVILMFLAPYIAVADEKGALVSIRASMLFVRQNILSIVGVALVLILIGFLSGLVLGLVFALLSLALQGTAAQVAFAALSSLINAFLGVMVTGAFMSLYLSRSTAS